MGYENNPHICNMPCPYCDAECEVKLSNEGKGAAYYRCPTGCGKWSFSKAKTAEIQRQLVMEKQNYDDQQTDDNQPNSTTSTDAPEGDGSGSGSEQPKSGSPFLDYLRS